MIWVGSSGGCSDSAGFRLGSKTGSIGCWPGVCCWGSAGSVSGLGTGSALGLWPVSARGGWWAKACTVPRPESISPINNKSKYPQGFFINITFIPLFGFWRSVLPQAGGSRSISLCFFIAAGSAGGPLLIIIGESSCC